LIHVSDWYATLLSAAGGEIPEGLDSINQWDALLGKVKAPRDTLIYNLDDKAQKGAMRVGDYKLVLGDQVFNGWVYPPEDNTTAPLDLLEYDNIDDYDEGDITRWELPTVRSFAELFEIDIDEIIEKEPIKLFLFNLKDDPNEHKDLSKRHPGILKDILQRVKDEALKIVPADVCGNDEKGDPKHWGNIWSPGWCS
ncbi:unnamed protein product, partial [Meganyctiphanes norvegica]